MAVGNDSPIESEFSSSFVVGYDLDDTKLDYNKRVHTIKPQTQIFHCLYGSSNNQYIADFTIDFPLDANYELDVKGKLFTGELLQHMPWEVDEEAETKTSKEITFDHKVKLTGVKEIGGITNISYTKPYQRSDVKLKSITIKLLNPFFSNTEVTVSSLEGTLIVQTGKI